MLSGKALMIQSGPRWLASTELKQGAASFAACSLGAFPSASRIAQPEYARMQKLLRRQQ